MNRLSHSGMNVHQNPVLPRRGFDRSCGSGGILCCIHQNFASRYGDIQQLPLQTVDRRGLTLLEVLLSMAILLLSLVAISHLVDIGSDYAVQAQFQATGTRLAKSKLDEVYAGVVAIATESSGTFEDQNEPEWNWSVTPNFEGTANLYQVNVRVWRDFKGRPFEITLTQFMIDPMKIGTAAQAEKPMDSSSSDIGGASGTGGGTSP